MYINTYKTSLQKYNGIQIDKLENYVRNYIITITKYLNSGSSVGGQQSHMSEIYTKLDTQHL